MESSEGLRTACIAMIGYKDYKQEPSWEKDCAHHLHNHATARAGENLVPKPSTEVGGRTECREETRTGGGKGCPEDGVWDNIARSRD